MPVVYCPGCQRFLPDRFVEGDCPHCNSPNARGDQCAVCGRVLDPSELATPRCRRCGTPPERRDQKHVFLRLSALQHEVQAWVSRQVHWRPNVRGVANSWLQRGLRDRAITRDLTWGIPVPLEGYEDKCIYVWFEAVIGYLSASAEWATRQGDPAAWRSFWQDPARHYYFMGKDNIFFHTIVWPAMLLGHGGLKLPDDVPANEYLTLGGSSLLDQSELGRVAFGITLNSMILTHCGFFYRQICLRLPTRTSIGTPSSAPMIPSLWRLGATWRTEF